MTVPRPTPTCTRHETTEIRCLACRGSMRLVTIVPGGENFELRTYACAGCDTGESFLVSTAARAGAGRRTGPDRT